MASGGTAFNVAVNPEIQSAIQTLTSEYDALISKMEKLRAAEGALGSENVGYASAEGLKHLEGQIRSAENELNTSKVVAAGLGEKLKSLSISSVLGRTFLPFLLYS